ncbi:MAG TPA: hypothetical protein VF230_03230 [Acidimicrobiales bacterium]
MANAGALVVVALLAVGAVALNIGREGTGETGVASSGSQTTETTVAGDSTVSTLAEVPTLALSMEGWHLLEARDSSGEGSGAVAVPQRHLRYESDALRGRGTALVSFSLFGVPPGSFYETMVPLLVATDGYSTVRVRGVEGRVQTSDGEDGVFVIAWRESDTAVAALWVRGVEDQQAALAIAEALEPVSTSTWSDMLRETPSPDRVTNTTLH